MNPGDQACYDTQGPRRRAWEAMKRRQERIRWKIRQLYLDLNSYNDQHPGHEISIGPRPVVPELPPMPKWEE